MNILESFKIALDSIRVNKLRSILTMLGIIIGVASVIAMTSLGNGLSNLVGSEINANGSNLLYVSSSTDNGFSSLTIDDASSILNHEDVTDVSETAYIITINSPVSSENDRRFSSVSTVSDNYFALTNIDTLEEGALFDADDGQVAVLGSSIAEDLFPEGDALGNTINISDIDFMIVGILEVDEDASSAILLPPGASERDLPDFLGGSEARMVYVPFSIAEESLALPSTENDEIGLTTIVVAANDETVVENATEQVSIALRDLHALADGVDDDFSIRSQSALADTFSTITQSLTLFLGAIAGISLFVGGIGIMNIMLVSVTERTREIGIRKALGARKRDILSQFMIESLVLSILGGLIGLMLGWGLSAMGGLAMGLTATLSPTMVAIAVGFSTVVGLIFGIYPAWKAAKLTPIVALRYE